MDGGPVDSLASWQGEPQQDVATSYHYGPGALEHGLAALGRLRSSAQEQWHSVIIADARVWRLHGEAVLAALESQEAAAPPRAVLLVEPGEASKTRREKERLEDAMFAAGVERRDLVLGVGGGVVLDLAGFTAATCLRGLRSVNITTSLLASVDAGLGGKTGVNTSAGKNLCGTFHWPQAVICDQGLLETLPAEEISVGLGEMIKHAVIVGDPLFAELASALAASSPGAGEGHGHPVLPPASLITAAARCKIAVVERDPFERGERRSLNLGHTVAHALEAASDFRLSHGVAVALGLLIEARVAVSMLGFPLGDLQRLEALIAVAGLPLRPSHSLEEAWPWMKFDKKTRGAQVRMGLPLRIGAMDEADGAWVRPVTRDMIAAAWTP